jgi:hypothetical protein
MNSSVILHREWFAGYEALLRIKAAAVRLLGGRAPLDCSRNVHLRHTRDHPPYT